MRVSPIFPSNYENNLDRNINPRENPKFSRHYNSKVSLKLSFHKSVFILVQFCIFYFICNDDCYEVRLEWISINKHLIDHWWFCVYTFQTLWSNIFTLYCFQIVKVEISSEIHSQETRTARHGNISRLTTLVMFWSLPQVYECLSKSHQRGLGQYRSLISNNFLEQVWKYVFFYQ